MQGKLKLAEKMGEVLCFIKMEINMMVIITFLNLL